MDRVKIKVQEGDGMKERDRERRGKREGERRGGRKTRGMHQRSVSHKNTY